MFFPALAMESIPGLVCLWIKFSSGKIIKSPECAEVAPQTFELSVTVDRFPARPVFLGEITSLNHKLHTLQTTGKC